MKPHHNAFWNSSFFCFETFTNAPKRYQNHLKLPLVFYVWQIIKYILCLRWETQWKYYLWYVRYLEMKMCNFFGKFVPILNWSIGSYDFRPVFYWRYRILGFFSHQLNLKFPVNSLKFTCYFLFLKKVLNFVTILFSLAVLDLEELGLHVTFSSSQDVMVDGKDNVLFSALNIGSG